MYKRLFPAQGSHNRRVARKSSEAGQKSEAKQNRRKNVGEEYCYDLAKQLSHYFIRKSMDARGDDSKEICGTL